MVFNHIHDKRRPSARVSKNWKIYNRVCVCVCVCVCARARARVCVRVCVHTYRIKSLFPMVKLLSRQLKGNSLSHGQAVAPVVVVRRLYL